MEQCLSIIGSWASIIGIIPVILGFCIYLFFNAKRKKNLKKLLNWEPRDKSAVLIVDIGAGMSIYAQVIDWLGNSDLKGIPTENIYRVDCRKNITSSDIDKIMDDFKRKEPKYLIRV